MKKIIIAAIAALTIMSCEKQDILDLQDENAAQAALIADLQQQINKLKTADLNIASEVVALQSSASSIVGLITSGQAELEASIAALTVSLASLSSEVEGLESEIDSLYIPSIDGLATTEFVEDEIEDAVEDIEASLESLEASVASITLELTGVASEVAAINPDEVVTSAWSPIFDTQVENFTQTNTSTLSDIVVATDSRLISVYSNEPVSTTVTSTVLEVGRSNVSGISSDTLNDAVVSQTTTTTLYQFHIEDADASAYEHTVTATSSWTLN